jgi:hypothetical protein
VGSSKSSGPGAYSIHVTGAYIWLGKLPRPLTGCSFLLNKLFHDADENGAPVFAVSYHHYTNPEGTGDCPAAECPRGENPSMFTMDLSKVGVMNSVHE